MSQAGMSAKTIIAALRLSNAFEKALPVPLPDILEAARQEAAGGDYEEAATQLREIAAGHTPPNVTSALPTSREVKQAGNAIDAIRTSYLDWAYQKAA